MMVFYMRILQDGVVKIMWDSRRPYPDLDGYMWRRWILDVCHTRLRTGKAL